MGTYFIIAQIVGIIAWIILNLSYHRKTTNKILVFQITGNVFFCLHYLMLGAYSGLFICFIETLFDFGYYKTDKDKLLYVISVPVRIIGGLLTYRTVVDTLPICASLLDGYCLTKKKKVVVIGAIITYMLWVIYDICVLSLSGAITDGIIMMNNIIIFLFKYRTLRD